LKSQYTAGQLLQTRLGGRVICEDKTLLFAEAPEAYKNIDTVVSDLQTAGLIKVVATLRPLITYKMRHEDGQE
jgi:release factor H-coupled RctB family protein